jgi:hypothetical protein
LRIKTPESARGIQYIPDTYRYQSGINDKDIRVAFTIKISESGIEDKDIRVALKIKISE